MAYIIYFFGSGLAFFVGVCCIAIAVLFEVQQKWWWLRRLATVLAAAGATFVALSSTPLPYWFYAVASAAVLVWFVAQQYGKQFSPKLKACLRIIILVCCIAGFAMEIPFHFTPAIPDMRNHPLWIIGDSVSAGTGDGKTVSWPQVLARTRSMTIQNLSEPGATVGTALRMLDKKPLGEGMVLLEIGGNDLLGTTATSDYEDRLDRLLGMVCQANRTVLLLELPLPPFRNDFAAVQRRLAAKHCAILIPKRIFVAVLTTADATTDGIHLTQMGHELMAEAVWGMMVANR